MLRFRWNVALAAVVAFALMVSVVVVGSVGAPSADAQTQNGFVPVTPCAVFDTRSGSAFGSVVGGQALLTAQVSGSVPTSQISQGCAQQGVVPVGAAAVMVNVVAVGPVASGNLRISRSGESANGGVVNFGPGSAGPGTNSNAVPVGLSAGGAVDVFVNAPAGVGATHVRLVVLGYYEAPATSQITGTITTNGSVPSATVRVCWQDLTSFAFGCEDADSTGGYTLSVAAGTYQLWAFDRAGNYALRVFDNRDEFADADPIVVADSATVAGVDFNLEIGGRISGIVTDETFVPLGGIRACLEIASSGMGRGCWTTHTDGTYEMGNLPAGDYHVRFFPPAESGYVVESYDDTTDFSQRATVVVVAGSTTANIDAALELGGTVSGTVTSASGQPLANIEVCANADDFSFRWCVRTDGAGNYVIGGLPPDDYAIGYVDLSGVFVSEYFADTPIFDFRSFVSVSAGQSVTSVDASLDSGAQGFSGTVTASGVPVAGIDVCPFVTLNGQDLYLTYGCSRTEADGIYELRGLPSGSYKLRFFDPSGTYRTEHFDDAPNFNDAVWLTPGAGMTMTGINADLSLGSTVMGAVTGEGTGPLGGIQVCARSLDGTFSWCENTAPDGSYAIRGLVPSLEYYVEFVDWSGSFARQYFDNTSNWAAKTTLVPNPGEVIAGVDAVLDADPVTVSGRVTDAATSQPIPFVQVCPQPTSGGVGSCTRTASDGTYELFGVSADDYRIRFALWNGSGYDYVVQYFDDALYENADILALLPGDIVNSVDAALRRGGTIVGTVTSASSGSPLANVEVCPTRLTVWNDAVCARTAGDGSYSLDALAPGTYALTFNDIGGNYLFEWFDGAFDPANLTPVSVIEGATSVVNATLEQGQNLAPGAGSLGAASDSVSPFAQAFETGKQPAVPPYQDRWNAEITTANPWG